MKNDNLKRNDAQPPVISGDFVSTQSVVAITNLSVTGPYRGDFQVIDQGRVIVGENPDTGARGILAAKALQGFNSSGINTFAVWFTTTEAHAPGDFHAGNLAGNFLQYNQTDGTLGLYTPDGAGVIMDNDGTFIAGHQDHGHMKWDATSESLKIMSGREVMAEFGDGGSASFQGIVTATGGHITGRMYVDEVLQAGDSDGPAVYLGRFERTNDLGEVVESSEIMATDAANLPWFHVVAGGSTVGGGYFSLGNQGDYSDKLTFDGTNVVLSGGLIWAGGKGVADATGISHTENAGTFWRLKPAADVFMEINSSGDANYKALQVEENFGIAGYFKGGYIGVYGKSTTDEIGIMGYASATVDAPGAPPPTESGGDMTDGIEALNPGVSVYGLTEGGTAGRFVAQNSGAGGRALVAKSDDNTHMALFAWNTGTGPALVTDGSTKLGDGGTTNYAQFDDTGHLTFVGTAKPWTDMLIEPTARNTGTNAPVFEKWYDDAAGTSRGVYLYSFDDAVTNSEKEVFFNLQMSHAWDGGDIQFHVHWIGAVADTTATPRWGLEYVFKEPGAVFGDSTIIYAVGNHLSEADITANKHYITAFTAISPGSTANDLSSVLIGRLFRNSGDAADTYNAVGAKCGLLYIDAHYQIARIGSTDEYSA